MEKYGEQFEMNASLGSVIASYSHEKKYLTHVPAPPETPTPGNDFPELFPCRPTPPVSQI